MKLPTYQWFGQMLAAIGVMLSLGLVAYELKQSRDVATAELSISVMTMDRDVYESVLEADRYNQGLDKLPDGELTDREHKNIWRVYMINKHGWDAKHILWSYGLLADGEWEATREFVKLRWSQSPHLRPLDDDLSWLATRPVFTEVMQNLWEEWKAENPDVYKEWQAELAAPRHDKSYIDRLALRKRR